MTQITVNEDFQSNKYLLVSRIDESQDIQTTRILISDDRSNTIKVVSIEQGPQGDKGETGPQGPAGQDAPTFDVLPLSSGGTNNTTYSNGKIIYFDGDKLASTTYTVQDILDTAGTSNSVTGVLAGSGLRKIDSNSTVTLDTLLGEGLFIGSNNEIAIDNTIARTSELDLGTIQGQVPISKGGTNNNFYTQNRLVYFDGTKIKSFPIATGNFLLSGVSVNIVAGSGLVGGGNLQLPDGTVAINIPSSADIIVEDDLIQLSTTGTAGTYSKIITDDKGRVVSGTTLTATDIIDILGYTPYHPGNDGAGSNLDADLLDGQQGSYYRDAVNITGLLNPNVLPSAVVPGTYTKIGVDSNGLVSEVLYADQADIISSLGYTPVPDSGTKTIDGTTILAGDVSLNGETTIYDNLPILATNNSNILPDQPRGVSFIYGGLYSNKTGILAYYPANDELKLVTNVFASGSDTENGDEDDLNGGDANSVYVVSNLDGDTSIVLLRNIADNLYVKLEGDEEIAGQKVFVDNTTFRKQIYIDDPAGNIDAPFNVSSNTNLVTNLNVDLLDNEHGSYYNNAANATGQFTYTKVTFDHIQGTNTYIPKFNDNVNDPAGKIDDSIIYQNAAGDITLDDDQSLIIGSSDVTSATSSVSIGQSNLIDGDNNLVAGQNNAITGNNSVALNFNSKVNADNSVALGDHGYAYVPNQLSFGAFNYNDPETSKRLEHGQRSEITMHLRGVEAGDSWRTLSPTISIPNNKTFAYNLELLISKAFGTGVAQYEFASGIFKNATYRDSNNLTTIINSTTHPQEAKRKEIFNNSQIKNHYHTFDHTNGDRQQQDVRVTHIPIKNNDVSVQNTEQHYLYTKENKQVTGSYYKTNRGDLVLDINQPVYSGTFATTLSNRGIEIISANHGVKVGTEVDLVFSDVTGLPMANRSYKVYSVINQDRFYVEKPFYTGILNYYPKDESTSYADIILDNESIAVVDNNFLGPFDTDKNGHPLSCNVKGSDNGLHSGVCYNTLWRFIRTSGNINSNGVVTNLGDNDIYKYLNVNSEVVIQSGDYFFNRFVDSFNNNTITLNDPIATGEAVDGHQTVKLTGPIYIAQVDYAYSEFKRTPKLYLRTPNDGDQFWNTNINSESGKFQSPYQFSRPPIGSGLWYSPNSFNYVETGNYPINFNQNSNSKIQLDYTYWYSTGIWTRRDDIPTTIAMTGLVLPARETHNSGIVVELLPLLDNSGTVHLSHKTNVDGNFEWDNTVFSNYRCVYTRFKNYAGDDQIVIHTTGVENPIDITHHPVQYSLTPGYLDDDNDSFEIINDNNKFHLVARNPFDYETKNIYAIRIRANDYINDRFLEKNFTITINDKQSPYSHIDIPRQTTEIGDVFSYTFPDNIFNEEDNQGSLTFSAQQQNGAALPSWLSFDSSTRTFSGTPDGCDVGTYNIRVHAANNFDTIFKDFFITVQDSVYQVFDYTSDNNEDITDILVDATTIDENLPSGSLLTTLDCVGSYSPYLEFDTASNSFSGNLVNGSNFVECHNISLDFPTCSVTGSSDYLTLPSVVDIKSDSNDYTVVNRYMPFEMSGTPGLSDGKIYLVDSYQDNNNVFFSGQILYSSGSVELPRIFTVNDFNDYSASFDGPRTTLKTEDSDVYNIYEILTENSDHIVVDHGFLPLFMSTENSDSELGAITGITSENSGQFITPPQSGQRFQITDAFDTNILWASGYPNCTDRDLIENATVSYTDRTGDPTLVDITSNLQNFNSPPTGDLKRSNIKYDTDTFAIRDSIENPVIALYGIGQDKFDRFLAENGDIITAENSDRFISNDPKHYGTRIKINAPYELFDSYRTVKANGRIMIDKFDFLVAENSESIVHDYAIASMSGDACLFFPGVVEDKDIIFEYEEDVDQSDNVFNYYYNWGKLIQFSFINYKRFIKFSEPYTGSTSTRLITYSEDAAEDGNYPISGLKQHAYVQTTGCSVVSYVSGFKGFESDYASTGNYVTGLVDVYTQAGTGNITLNFNKDINLDTRKNYNIYAYDFASSHATLDLPVVGQYTGISIVDADTLEITNRYFMPNSGVQTGYNSYNRRGTFSANMDKGHNYVEEAFTIVNRIPVEFSDVRKKWHPTDTLVIDSTNNRKPKDYTFDIVSITGDKIVVRDDKNYLLKETNRPDYYEQSIKASYLTNGIAFSGSFFNSHPNIYDIRYNRTYLNHIYDKINFEYDHSSKLFSFVIKSGVIQPFDNIEVTFPTGYAYSSDPIRMLVDDTMIGRKTGLKDLDPLRDNMLLETSATLETTDEAEDIIFTGIMTHLKDAAGTCTVDNSLINRLQSGLMINHSNSDKYGYEIDSLVSGFIFSGVIPKNHNVLSTNILQNIDSNHIGHASVFATGSDALYEGSRIVREATVEDIGYSEYYCIDSSVPNFNVATGISGVGNSSNPYYHDIITGPNNKSGYLEFIYLGQNSNRIHLDGTYNISGVEATGLRIFHTTFSEQAERYRLQVNRQVPAYQTEVYRTGSLNNPLTGKLNLTLNVNRFDKIKVFVDTNNSHHYLNNLLFKTKTLDDVTIKPYILENSEILNTHSDYFPYINPNEAELVYTPVPTFDSNDCVDCDTKLPQYIPQLDPNYRQLLSQDYHILPYIKTNNLYCGSDRKNEQVFFNGNILKMSNFNTIKSFLLEEDEFIIDRFNSVNIADSGVSKHLSKFNPTSESGVVSGIVIEGPRTIPPKLGDTAWDLLYENSFRHRTPLGVSHDQLLSKRGIVEFTKTASGLLNVIDYNNIYYHTDGGVTSRYSLDSTGAAVPIPQTGTYSVMFDTDTCMSGTLCVTISGITTAAFTGVNPGKTMFFDFDDEAPALTNTYPIKDLISPNALTISPPFDASMINRSGLVYIIDSEENIKSHLNPNKDNAFNVLEGSVYGLTNTSKKILNYFDNDSKRWKHTIHFEGEQPSPTGHIIRLGGQSQEKSTFYSILPHKIQISGIQYRFNDDDDFVDISNNALSIPDNINQVMFKITTNDGDLSLYSGIRHAIPKVSMSGIGIYQLEFNEPASFGWHGSGWNIGLKWSPPKEDYTNKDIIIRTSDLTGDADQIISISKYKIPEITSFYSTTYATSGSMWEVGFDITKLDIDSKLASNELFMELADMPDSNNYTKAYADDISVVFSGDTRGANTGIYNLELTVKDITTTPYTTLGVVTGVLSVLDHIADRPDYEIELNNMSSTFYINMDRQEQVKFSMPALLGPLPSEATNNLNITFNTDTSYNLSLDSASYNTNTKRFDIVATPKTTGDSPVYIDTSNRYVNQSVSISVKQAVYDEFGGYTYQTYNTNQGFNIVFYKDVIFQGIPQSTTIPFTTNEPWSMEFYVISGITEHDASNKPNAKIFNAPNLGTYQSEIPQYNLTYSYEADVKKWRVEAVGNADALNRFIAKTGLYPISIYLEDGYSSNTSNDDYSILYESFTKMKNISADVYTTPNNAFFTKADIFDLNENQSNQISFPASLKESSISLPTNNMVRKYDRHLNIWTNSYVSDLMTKRWDARFNLQGNTISVDCKGLGKDKIMAVAKLSTMEIESNELQGVPLKITGILGYIPGGAIDVDQGDEGWGLEFKTIGGLAHANYPPTIILEDMPTFCTGFNPLIETQLQCLISPPRWSANDQGGSWSYHFSGIPSCVLLGRKDFTITAIDTDTSLLPGSPYLPNTDQVPYTFNYIEGNFDGNHPTISGNSDYDGMDVMLPFCNTYYTKQLNFFPGPEALCSFRTGIKSYEVSGSVPPGLTYSQYFPEDGNSPVAPYSNLAGGYLRIEGYPTTFASGQAYAESLKLIVTDARDKTVEQTITFNDASVPNEPDIGMAVYFKDENVAITPKSGLDLIEKRSQEVGRPPTIEESLTCRSILPHNKCGVSTILFSGTSVVNNLNIYLIQSGENIPSEQRIQHRDNIYIAFDTYNDGNDGAYVIHSDDIGIHISGQESLQNPNQIAPITGDALVLKGKTESLNLADFDSFFEGNIVTSTQYCILGGGVATQKRSEVVGGSNNQRGLLGALVPSHKASITGLQPFEDISDLRLDRINPDVDTVSTVSWSDCHQTGVLYISGISIPEIHAEVVDPPPAQDYYFSFNGIRFALATRLAFGETEAQRLLPGNNRNASLQYDIIDMMSGVSIQQGSVSAGSSFDTTTLSRDSGTVYKLTISKESDIFPTYNYQATPESKNEYIWTHKGSNLSVVPTQETFPPLISAGIESISVTNSLTDSDPNGVVMSPVIGILAGGYIPTDAGIGDAIPYSHSGNISVSGAYSMFDFLPKITGIIQKELLKVGSTGLPATYTSSNNSLRISGVNPVVGDMIKVDFYKSYFGQTSLEYSDNIVVAANDIDDDYLSLNLSLGASNLNGYAVIDFRVLVHDVDLTNNELVLSGVFDYSVGDSIGVDKNRFISTDLNLLEYNGYVSVASGDGNIVYLENTNPGTGWLEGFHTNDYVKVYENIDDNIKIMPYNTVYNTEGKYTFQITGRSNTRENEDLIYKIGAMDNLDTPVFDTVSYPLVGITPKKYFTNYPLYINKPIAIVTSTVSKVGEELTFSISGGQRPLYSHSPDVQIAAGINGDYDYCGFMRHTTGTGSIIYDEYNSTTDTLDVRLTLSSDYGIDWSVHNTVKIQVSDETGQDNYIYTY